MNPVSNAQTLSGGTLRYVHHHSQPSQVCPSEMLLQIIPWLQHSIFYYHLKHLPTCHHCLATLFSRILLEDHTCPPPGALKVILVQKTGPHPTQALFAPLPWPPQYGINWHRIFYSHKNTHLATTPTFQSFFHLPLSLQNCFLSVFYGLPIEILPSQSSFSSQLQVIEETKRGCTVQHSLTFRKTKQRYRNSPFSPHACVSGKNPLGLIAQLSVVRTPRILHNMHNGSDFLKPLLYS